MICLKMNFLEEKKLGYAIYRKYPGKQTLESFQKSQKISKKISKNSKKKKTLIRLGTIPLYKFNCCQNVKNHSVTIISSIYRFNHIFPFAHKILRILTKPIQFLLTLLLGIFHRSYIFTTSPVSFSIRQKWLARG